MRIYLRKCKCKGTKKSPKSKKETIDTILKNLFLWVLMSICVSVHFLKKSWPKRQAHVNLHLIETKVQMCSVGGEVRGRWPFIGEKIIYLGKLGSDSIIA
jgi:hypothetical protein